jgi:ketosteroid isomerase-like protein
VTTSSPVGVVERMLDHAANGRWRVLHDVLSPRFEIVEPDSLPYGGVHRGVSGYVALMQRIGELFALKFEPESLDAIDDCTVVLQMHVTFTARSTSRQTRLPVVEVLRVVDGRVEHSRVFVFDTAALLATLT